MPAEETNEALLGGPWRAGRAGGQMERLYHSWQGAAGGEWEEVRFVVEIHFP